MAFLQQLVEVALAEDVGRGIVDRGDPACPGAAVDEGNFAEEITGMKECEPELVAEFRPPRQLNPPLEY